MFVDEQVAERVDLERSQEFGGGDFCKGAFRMQLREFRIRFPGITGKIKRKALPCQKR